MAKMFYSLEEAAAKLGKGADEVKRMADTGQLQEFRDSANNLVFKRDQVDLLTGGGDDDDAPLSLGDSSAGASGSMIPLDLDDSGMGMGSGGLEPLSGGSGSAIDLEGSGFDIGLEASGSAPGLGADPRPENPKEGTGISIFDVDDDDADPSAQTQVTDGVDFTPEFAADAGASGSGLLDLTRESDDTSLGADLLDDLYGGGDTQGDSGDAAPIGEASALFESTGAESDVSAAGAGVAMVPVAMEVYDGTWSGIAGGVALGASLAMALAISVVILGMTGGGGPLMEFVGGNMMAVLGGLVGVVVIAAVVGMLLGKRSG